MHELFRTRWAAIGAAIAVTLGAGGVSLTQASLTSGDRPVYVSLEAPCRVIDTRSGSPIGPGAANSLTVQITGANGECTGAREIPADAVGVSTNVTAIQPNGAASGRSYLTVYPADATRPVTSNLNFLNGQPPTPNKVDVGLSGDGKITIYNHDGTVHAAVDIFGYYTDHHHDDRYYTQDQTYTQDQVDALVAAAVDEATDGLPETMWVVTDGDEPPSIVRQSGGISLYWSGDGGSYFYTFPRDTTSCYWTASLGGPDEDDHNAALSDDLGIVASQWYHPLDGVVPDEIIVTTPYQDGAGFGASAHSLVVHCP